MTTYTKYVDTTKCTACRGCMVSCKNWNELPAEIEAFHGSYQSHEKVTANTWCLIKFNEQEVNGVMQWHFMKDACKHCVDAACVKACPQDALFHTETGAVNRDWDKCIGCGYCVTHCPFDVIEVTEYAEDGRAIIDDAAQPTFREEPGNMNGVRRSQYNGKIVKKSNKCDLCQSRVDNGQKPACVTSCPSGVLEFGDRAEMLSKAEARLAEIKAKYPNANIYNPSSISGTNVVYVLAEAPEFYGLPNKPVVPASLSLWKDIVQPLGKVAFGGAAAVIAASYIMNKRSKGTDHAEEQSESKGGDA